MAHKVKSFSTKPGDRSSISIHGRNVTSPSSKLLKVSQAFKLYKVAHLWHPTQLFKLVAHCFHSWISVSRHIFFLFYSLIFQNLILYKGLPLHSFIFVLQFLWSPNWYYLFSFLYPLKGFHQSCESQRDLLWALLKTDNITHLP